MKMIYQVRRSWKAAMLWVKLDGGQVGCVMVPSGKHTNQNPLVWWGSVELS